MCLGWVGGGCILSWRQTCTQLNTQSCIRLCGETNPVTVSGNLSALTCYTPDFTETVGLVTKKICVCVFVLLFICKRHVAPITGMSYQWLSTALTIPGLWMQVHWIHTLSCFHDFMCKRVFFFLRFYCPQHNPSCHIIISSNYSRRTKVRNEKQSHQVVKWLQPGTFMISASAYHWGVSKQCWHCLWHAALEQYDTFTDISFNLSLSANLASCAAR